MFLQKRGVCAVTHIILYKINIKHEKDIKNWKKIRKYIFDVHIAIVNKFEHKFEHIQINRKRNLPQYWL